MGLMGWRVRAMISARYAAATAECPTARPSIPLYFVVLWDYGLQNIGFLHFGPARGGFLSIALGSGRIRVLFRECVCM